MRIASLLPGATEILCALGLRDQLVAISHECDYPADILDLPRVSSTLLSSAQDCAAIDAQVAAASGSGEALNLLDVQGLQALRADLIVSQSLCDVCAIDSRTIQTALAPQTGSCRIIGLDGADFDGILQDIHAIARATGCSDAATQLCDSLRNRWRAVTPEPLGDSPRLLFVEWPDPGFYAGHWVPQMVRRAGAVDILGVAGQRSGVFEWSQALRAEPQVIVFGCCGFGLQRNAELANTFRNGAIGREMVARAGGGLWAVDANGYFSRPGPRVVEGLEALAELLRGSETEGISQRL